MSLLATTNKRNIITGSQAYVGDTASFAEIVRLSDLSNSSNFNAISKLSVTKEVTKTRDKSLEDAGYNPSAFWVDDPKASGKILNIDDFLPPEEMEQRRQTLIDEGILKLRQEDPDTFNAIKTSQELQQEAQYLSKKRLQEFDEAMEYTPGASKYFASFIGGAFSLLKDPVQVMSLPIGASYSLGSSVLKFAFREAAISGAVEAAIQPAIKDWQDELGQKYGIKEASVNVALAAASAGLISLPIGGYLKGKYKASEIARQLSTDEALPESVRQASAQLELSSRAAESSPSPDVDRHIANIDAANKATIEGRRVTLDDIDTRIIDDVDGIPAQAFDFLDPDAEFKIISTPKKKGGAPFERTVSLREMSDQQLRQTVLDNILPKIREEMKIEYANEARKLGVVKDGDNRFISDTLESIKNKLEVENIQIKNKLKETKKNIYTKRDAQLSRKNKPTVVAEIKTQAKREIDKANKEYKIRKNEIDNELLQIGHKQDRLDLQKERKQVMKEMAKGLEPAGDGYTAAQIRKTIDKIVDIAKERRNVPKQRASEIQEVLEDTGVIPTRPMEADDALEQLDEALTELDENMDYIMNQLDEGDLDEVIVTEDGKQTTIRKLMESDPEGQAELDAMTSCATGGSA